MNKLFSYFFQNATFEIVECASETVGKNMLKKKALGVSNKPKFDWTSNEKKPFIDLFMNRLYFVNDGSALMKTKSGNIEFQKNTAYFIPAYSILSTACDELLDHSFIHFIINSPIANFFSICNPKISHEGNQEIYNCFKQIQDLHSKKNPLSSTPQAFLKKQGYFRILLSYFLPEQEVHNDTLRFIDVLNQIDTNFNKDLTLKDLSDTMNMNSAYFSSLFTQTFGISPIHFLIRKRLSVSQQLLTNTALSIKEISDQCGFNDPLYFSRLFRRKIGISPNSYRSQFSD